MSDFYKLNATTIQGTEKSMEEYKGKVVLIVNTASKCGLTPQYEGLEELHNQFKDKGLVILGFPCNQFGGQEPGTEKDIQENCLINYGVSFQMFSKIDVNGKNESPIYTLLKKEKSTFLGSKIKWNFAKFLLDKDGKVVRRYSPTTIPSKLKKQIESLLK